MKLSICSCVKFLSAGTDKHFAATVCTAMESKRYTCGHFEVMHMSCDHLIQLQGVLAALLNCPNLLLASIRHKTGGKVTAKLSTGLSAATNTTTSHPPAKPSSPPHQPSRLLPHHPSWIDTIFQHANARHHSSQLTHITTQRPIQEHKQDNNLFRQSATSLNWGFFSMVIIPSRRDVLCCALGWEVGEAGRVDLLRKEGFRKDPGSCLLPDLLGPF